MEITTKSKIWIQKIKNISPPSWSEVIRIPPPYHVLHSWMTLYSVISECLKDLLDSKDEEGLNEIFHFLRQEESESRLFALQVFLHHLGSRLKQPYLGMDSFDFIRFMKENKVLIPRIISESIQIKA